ncbi:hypothetical protein ES705_18501 [subsurface metagenome]
MANVTESLAGRAGILQLPVFSVSESPSGKEHILKKCFETIFKGFYPDCYLENVERSFFYSSYIQTYIERDVRQIINISDLSLFHLFITLVASRLGSILNLNEIAREAEVSFNSVKKWLSVLQDQDMILTNSLISLTLKEGETLGVNPELDGVERGSVDRIINPAVPHKNKIVKDQYNVMLLKFKNQYNIEFRAYDDGIAYRFDDPSWIRPGKVALTIIFIAPNSFTICSATLSRSVLLEASTLIANVSTLYFANSSAFSRAFSRFKSRMTISAPAFAKPSAMQPANTPPPPMTTAVLLSSE